jgi:hypothetical protein
MAAANDQIADGENQQHERPDDNEVGDAHTENAQELSTANDEQYADSERGKQTVTQLPIVLSWAEPASPRDHHRQSTNADPWPPIAPIREIAR